MKNIILVCLLFIVSSSVLAQVGGEKFYYYQGEKVFLTENRSKVLIKILPSTSKRAFIETTESDPNYTLLNRQDTIGQFVVLEAKKARRTAQEQGQSLSKCKGHKGVLCANYMLEYKNSQAFGVSDEIVVKLKPQTTINQLEELSKQYEVRKIEENKYCRGKFTVSMGADNGMDPLSLSNVFFETGLFEYAEPNFVFQDALNSNDPSFGEQWPLRNSYAGIDVEKAWGITEGNPDIKVAIIDEGVDLNHPDLRDNLLPGFDATGHGSKGAAEGNAAHGTACAGIIGAIKDNGLGMAGVAPKVKMIPIRIAYDPFFSASNTADAFEWAWQNGADVISNSWSGPTPINQVLEAINHAVDLGRGGLGSVVLGSTGNKSTRKDPLEPNYPAAYPNVIAVGATSNEGLKEEYSQFGSALDVVAPGGDKNVYTTDISGEAGYNDGNYTSSFDGTSAACPHAAGVVALILSVNNSLTWQEVKKVLELSCDKTGHYCYRNSSAYPNGTWNNEMGYGRVNAFKAVQYAHSTNVTTMNNIGGNDQGGTDWFYQLVMHNNGCTSLAASSYFVKRHEVHRTISFPYTESPIVLGSSNGLSGANPNNGAYWMGYQNLSPTSVTLKTHVYEVVSLWGQSLGWVPRHPSYIRFNVTIMSALSTDRFLQNESISSGTRTINAMNKIAVGHNVTTTTSQGDVVVGGTTNMVLRAGNMIEFSPGTNVLLSGGGSFLASVDPFFTRAPASSARVAGLQRKPFVKTYHVTHTHDGGEEESDSLALRIYPNPLLGDKATLEYNLLKDSEVRLLFYSADGVELTQLVNKDIHKAGDYKIMLELNDYLSGVYIVKLITNHGVISRQLIKQ